MNLHPDQQELIAKTRAAMATSRSVLMVSPTGSGKTAMALSMIKSAQGKNKRILFSTPRRDLLEQTSETFRSMDVAHSYVAADKAFNPYAQVYLGMLPTMDRRIERLPDIDLLIVDECHYGSGAMDRIIEQYKARGTYILGLSATPWKLSGQGLGRWYDAMVEGKSVRWLIDNKRLSDFRYFYGRTKPDLSKISVTAGDYAKGELSSYMEEQGVIIGDCVADYKLRCMGNIHVVRCASVKHSQITAEAFRAAGIAAMHVDGETPPDERRRIFRALAMRQIQVVTFVDLLSFGFDLSQAAQMDVCIESISDLRPTKSLAGMMQYWGRALRMKEKPAIINDHVNNYVEHYFPDTPRVWTLESREQGKRSTTERAIPVAQCKACFYAFRPAPICPNCGAAVVVKSRDVEQVAGELREMSKEEREAMRQREVRDRKREQALAKTFPELVALARKRGMKNPTGWATFIIRARAK